MVKLGRPADMFDREWEWEALTHFMRGDRPGPGLGVVSGRRRQGKSFLLQSLCEASGGFYYQATQAAERDALSHLGSELAAYTRSPAPLMFSDWQVAVGALLELSQGRNLAVVLDEFPYLAQGSPSLPSVIQAALGPRASSHTKSKARLILCGSAVSFMGKLLSGQAPLRGRSGLELIVQPFDYRQASTFWGLAGHPELALKVNAVVGGTPAYRREFVNDDAPAGPRDFDAWVVRTALNPALGLLREGRYLLAEEPGLRDPALYHSVLAAIAAGAATRGAIASALGRPSADIAHPLAVLEDVEFVIKRQDCIRAGRPTYRIADPMVRFYHAIIRPASGRLGRPGRAENIWRQAQPRFRSQILGPHFEQLCRDWTENFAAPKTLGSAVVSVGAGVVNDPANRSSYEIDVVAFGEDASAGKRRVLALGEAKWGSQMGMGDLGRLQRAMALLANRKDLDLQHCRPACFSTAGFTSELEAVAKRGEAVLVGAERLLQGE